MSLFNIEEFLDLSNYITYKRKNRRKNHGSTNETAEFFTPYSIVQRMADIVIDLLTKLNIDFDEHWKYIDDNKQ